MAISDSLFVAVGEIDHYLDALPDTYQPVREELLKVRTLMNAARLALDCPPGCMTHQKEEIWCALRSLKTSEVERAVEAWNAFVMQGTTPLASRLYGFFCTHLNERFTTRQVADALELDRNVAADALSRMVQALLLLEQDGRFWLPGHEEAS